MAAVWPNIMMPIRELNNELLGMMPHETPPIRAHVYGPPPLSLDDDEAWKRVDAPQRWQREVISTRI